MTTYRRGSRYRDVRESGSVTAAGERARGKNLRVIAPPVPRVQHTVAEGDRLPLLALKYYGDPTRWWQIADGNPQRAFPLDLVEGRPIVDETFTLEHVDFEVRAAQLYSSIAPFLSPLATTTHFLASTIAGEYVAASPGRPQIVQAIAAQRFRVLRSSAWLRAGRAFETFTFEDPDAKAAWERLVRQLREAPGVMRVLSRLAETTLALTYNEIALSRSTLTTWIAGAGFTILGGSGAERSAVGRVIGIPANQG